MAEPKTPWLYPYREDPQQTRLGQPVFRPFVPVSLATGHASTPELEGLVDTGADARAAIFEWIEVFYNRQRLHTTLNYASPQEFEDLSINQLEKAA